MQVEEEEEDEDEEKEEQGEEEEESFWSRPGVVLGLLWGCSGVVLGSP